MSHSWRHTYFKKPTWCGVCKDFIWGVISKQGYKCTVCKLISHANCRSNATNVCVPKTKTVDNHSGADLRVSNSSSGSTTKEPVVETAPISGASQNVYSTPTKTTTSTKSTTTTPTTTNTQTAATITTTSTPVQTTAEPVPRRSSFVQERPTASTASEREKQPAQKIVPKVNEKSLNAFFDKYADEITKKIEPGGLIKLIEDLGTTPEDVVMLVVAYYFKAQTMGEFTREEFVNGFKLLGVDTLESAKQVLQSLRAELSDPTIFREIFKFSFAFYKERKEAKVIDLAVVDALLELLIPNKTHIPSFREFLKSQTEYKVMNLDQWMNVLSFSNEIGPNFEGYVDDGEWPVIFDLFVTYVNTQKGPKEEKKEGGEDSNKSEEY